MKANTAVLGCAGVGKTSFIIKFVNDDFRKEYLPTETDFFSKDIEVGSEVLTINVSDVGGGPQCEIERDKIIKNCDAFIIIYDITNMESFEAVKDIRGHILALKAPDKDIPIIIVGNKADLNSQRSVLKADGIKLALEMNCLFFETSAFAGDDVYLVFLKLVLEMQKVDKWYIEKDGKHKKHIYKCCLIL